MPFELLVYPIFQNRICSLIILDWKNKINYVFDQSFNITEDTLKTLIDSFSLNLSNEYDPNLVKKNTIKFWNHYTSYQLSSDVYICMCAKSFLSKSKVQFNVNDIDFER